MRRNPDGSYSCECGCERVMGHADEHIAAVMHFLGEDIFTKMSVGKFWRVDASPDEPEPFAFGPRVLPFRRDGALPSLDDLNDEVEALDSDALNTSVELQKETLQGLLRNLYHDSIKVLSSISAEEGECFIKALGDVVRKRVPKSGGKWQLPSVKVGTDKRYPSQFEIVTKGRLHIMYSSKEGKTATLECTTSCGIARITHLYPLLKFNVPPHAIVGVRRARPCRHEGSGARSMKQPSKRRRAAQVTTNAPHTGEFPAKSVQFPSASDSVDIRDADYTTIGLSTDLPPINSRAFRFSKDVLGWAHGLEEIQRALCDVKRDECIPCAPNASSDASAPEFLLSSEVCEALLEMTVDGWRIRGRTCTRDDVRRMVMTHKEIALCSTLSSSAKLRLYLKDMGSPALTPLAIQLGSEAPDVLIREHIIHHVQSPIAFCEPLKAERDIERRIIVLSDIMENLASGKWLPEDMMTLLTSAMATILNRRVPALVYDSFIVKKALASAYAAASGKGHSKTGGEESLQEHFAANESDKRRAHVFIRHTHAETGLTCTKESGSGNHWGLTVIYTSNCSDNNDLCMVWNSAHTTATRSVHFTE